jgi:hypothetical protein
MSLIDLEDFKEILGVGEIYADSLLESAMESAENLILGFLLFHRASIVAVNIRSNVATFETRSPHGYVIGQQVTISNVGNPFDGTHTITRVGEYTFQASITNADILRRLNIPDGDCILQGQSSYYDTNENCRTAALNGCGGHMERTSIRIGSNASGRFYAWTVSNGTINLVAGSWIN